jgi:DNA-binding CsgD family transcriptional regulator
MPSCERRLEPVTNLNSALRGTATAPTLRCRPADARTAVDHRTRTERRAGSRPGVPAGKGYAPSRPVSSFARPTRPAQLSPGTRLLAAADVYHALTEPRPHRPARTPEQAAQVLREHSANQKLDPNAVNAVLFAAGHRSAERRTRREYPGGLTAREVEVLRLVARGSSDRQIGAQLVVSERTAHHHVEHIYDKLGVSTRAAAAFVAMQHAH